MSDNKWDDCEKKIKFPRKEEYPSYERKGKFALTL